MMKAPSVRVEPLGRLGMNCRSSNISRDTRGHRVSTSLDTNGKIAWALLSLMALLPTAAHADPHEAWQAPTLSITRYDEDWSDLEDADKRAHHWTGRFKYIPITDDVWVSTGIELRARNENYQNNLWGGGDARTTATSGFAPCLMPTCTPERCALSCSRSSPPRSA